MSREPARVAPAMQRRVAGALARIRWNRAATLRFLGQFLSEPKPHVYFDLPAAPLSRAAFAKAIGQRGVVLDRRTHWLYDDAAIYVNGDAHPWPAGDRASLERLANARALDARSAAALPSGSINFLHEGYCHGFLHAA